MRNGSSRDGDHRVGVVLINDDASWKLLQKLLQNPWKGFVTVAINVAKRAKPKPDPFFIQMKCIMLFNCLGSHIFNSFFFNAIGLMTPHLLF